MKLLEFLQFLAFLIKACEMASQCKTIESVYNKYLENHVITTETATDPMHCTSICDNNLKCKSWNFRLNDKKCELNDADRYTHPQNYQDKLNHVYCDSTKALERTFYESCADLKQREPGAQSGYYRIKIKDKQLQVYCDMDKYGGGWTLIVSISSSNNDHLQRAQHNCFNSILCVPFNNVTIPSQKLSDDDIHEIRVTEGPFRVDDLTSVNTVFYRIPSGLSDFDSSCRYGTCPRIITSHSHPYVWESNCKGTQLGYKIHHGCHSVFDGHDNKECNASGWRSSQYNDKRILYGYCRSKGLYPNRQGLLFVK